MGALRLGLLPPVDRAAAKVASPVSKSHRSVTPELTAGSDGSRSGSPVLGHFNGREGIRSRGSNLDGDGDVGMTLESRTGASSPTPAFMNEDDAFETMPALGAAPAGEVRHQGLVDARSSFIDAGLGASVVGGGMGGESSVIGNAATLRSSAHAEPPSALRPPRRRMDADSHHPMRSFHNDVVAATPGRVANSVGGLGWGQALLKANVVLAHRYFKGLLPGFSGVENGRLLPYAAWTPLPLPRPPVRPDSVGGFATAALRPFPPFLLNRLYQKVTLNPSPAFRVRFLKDMGVDGILNRGGRLIENIANAAPRPTGRFAAARDVFGVAVMSKVEGRVDRILLRGRDTSEVDEDPRLVAARRLADENARMLAAFNEPGDWDPDVRLAAEFPHGVPSGAIVGGATSGLAGIEDIAAKRRRAAGAADVEQLSSSSLPMSSDEGFGGFDGESLLLSAGHPSLLSEQASEVSAAPARRALNYVEVESGEETDRGLWAGDVRLFSDSALLMRSAALRHMVAFALPWSYFGGPHAADASAADGFLQPEAPDPRSLFAATLHAPFLPGGYRWELPRRRFSFPSLSWRRRDFFEPGEIAADDKFGFSARPYIAFLLPRWPDLLKPWPPHGHPARGAHQRPTYALLDDVGVGTEGGIAPARLFGPSPAVPRPDNPDDSFRRGGIERLQAGAGSGAAGLGPRAFAAGGAARDGSVARGYGDADGADVWNPAGPLAQAPDSLAASPAFLDALDAHWVEAPFALLQATADIEGRTLHRAGVGLCGCGCGKPWGVHSTFPAYEGAGWLRGSDPERYVGSAAYIKRAVRTGATRMLLQDPGFNFGCVDARRGATLTQTFRPRIC